MWSCDIMMLPVGVVMVVIDLNPGVHLGMPQNQSTKQTKLNKNMQKSNQMKTKIIQNEMIRKKLHNEKEKRK